MQTPDPAQDSTMRRRTTHQDNSESPDQSSATTARVGAPAPAPAVGEETPQVGTSSSIESTEGGILTPVTGATAAAAAAEAEAPISNGDDDGDRVFYNGRVYNGTGRLPRDAPFTPTYINAYTFNSAVAFISLIVTGTFFYFKIIVGILESPQIGPDREFLFKSSMGPADKGIPRPILVPNCPTPAQIQEHHHHHQNQNNQESWSGGGTRSQEEDDCLLFGKIMVLADSISTYGHTHATHGWLSFLADEWTGRADVVLRGFPAPVHDAMWEASLTAANQTLDRSNSLTKEYVDACVRVGEELHVPVVNLWSDISCQVELTCELHESDQLEDYLMDGFHLRRMGNEVLYKGVMNAVAQHYPRLHPTCWPTVFPGYSSESSPEMSVLKRHCNRAAH
ncbi:isoamyl acetate-hydrolyzing esterase [Modicella reniformis]|uniref:Isoamyl acetate-hydrolyzing esterase n=1 Tax=Modicella reniformis TaxID=1440133 RepID=A0A9P6MF47_9FUNG|nr:isoamyl acetate-hydrolyzing esterase [Modicella reniformis]